MDHSSRQRYRARRKVVERRRRLIALVVALVGVLVLVVFVFNRPGSSPDAADALPTTEAEPTQDGVLQATVVAETPLPSIPDAPDEPRPTIPDPPAPPPSAAVDFFDDRRLMYEPNFYTPQIQSVLEQQGGRLAQLTIPVGNRQHNFAEVLVGQTSYYSVNPQVLLALIELQSGLVSDPTPSDDQYGWALGYQGEDGNRRGLRAQVRWAVRQTVLAKRDYPQRVPLTYADETTAPPAADWSLSEYVIARVLAPTTTPERLPRLMQQFLSVYIQMFDDPRIAPEGWPEPAEPFMVRPTERTARVTSFFDHDTPFLSPTGSITTYWGRQETQIYYDGHDGWDYALAPPDLALAAADALVVFAGNADDNCDTPAVILDHGNGYRTLYWHLHEIYAQIGQQVAVGDPIGMIGNTGCSLGPHLHMGVQYLGVATDAYGWCGAMPDPWANHPAGTVSTWLWADRPSPCEDPPEGAVVVNTDSPGFSTGGDGWLESPIGYHGGALYSPSVRGMDERRPWDLRPLTEPVVAVYQPDLPQRGRYRVIAYVPYALNGLDDATRVRYRIRYSGGEAEVDANAEVYANDWVELGTYTFAPEDRPLVSISNLSNEGQRGVWADAVMWIPVEDEE